MSGAHCPECGAQYPDAADSCTARFDTLLALDHSRQEPWGSRHGLAFAVFALQHAARYPTASHARAHELLTRVLMRGEPLEGVIEEFRRRPDPSETERNPAVPPLAAHAPFAVTIADLGDFDAEGYAAQLEAWCRATLDALTRTG